MADGEMGTCIERARRRHWVNRQSKRKVIEENGIRNRHDTWTKGMDP
jgi:hypothetical protein